MKKGTYYMYKLNNSYTVQTKPSTKLHEGLLLREATLSQCVDYLAANCTITSDIIFQCQGTVVNIFPKFTGSDLEANKELLRATILKAYWGEFKATMEAKARIESRNIDELHRSEPTFTIEKTKKAKPRFGRSRRANFGGAF